MKFCSSHDFIILVSRAYNKNFDFLSTVIVNNN